VKACARLVSRLRHSGVFCDVSPGFRPGLTNAAPTPLGRGQSGDWRSQEVPCAWVVLAAIAEREISSRVRSGFVGAAAAGQHR
jgi:hypothetical protein